MGLVFTPGNKQIKYFSFDCRSTTTVQRQTLEIGAPATVFPNVGQQCPNGEAVNGLQGRFGQHVNGAGLECAPLNVSGPAPSPISPAPTASTVPPDWAAMLESHNDFRAGHCAAPLTWDAQLAAAAQAYAQQCNPNQHGSGGENLAAYCPPYPATSDVTVFQNIWTCEEGHYDYNNPVVQGGFKKNCDPPVNGHFTQLVWKDTRRVGCGRNTCNIGGSQQTVWVCRYSPPGNVNAGDPNVLRQEVQRPPCH